MSEKYFMLKFDIVAKNIKNCIMNIFKKYIQTQRSVTSSVNFCVIKVAALLP